MSQYHKSTTFKAPRQKIWRFYERNMFLRGGGGGSRVNKKYLIDIYLFKVSSGSQKGCKSSYIYIFSAYIHLNLFWILKNIFYIVQRQFVTFFLLIKSIRIV